VNAAFARAKKNGKRVLIDLGGNWCPDCIVLANLMQLPELKRFLAAHFEIVSVDVGRFDKNLQIPARFGITKDWKACRRSSSPSRMAVRQSGPHRGAGRRAPHDAASHRRLAGAMGEVGAEACDRRSSSAQMCLSLAEPRLLVRHRQRIEVPGVAAASSTHWRSSGEPLMTSMASLPCSYSYAKSRHSE